MGRDILTPGDEGRLLLQQVSQHDVVFLLPAEHQSETTGRGASSNVNALTRWRAEGRGAALRRTHGEMRGDGTVPPSLSPPA